MKDLPKRLRDIAELMEDEGIGRGDWCDGPTVRKAAAEIEQLRRIVDIADDIRCRWIEENGPSLDLTDPVQYAIAELEAAACIYAMDNSTEPLLED